MFWNHESGRERSDCDTGKARKIFDIQPGDNLIILGDESQGIAIIKEKRLMEILNGNE